MKARLLLPGLAVAMLLTSPAFAAPPVAAPASSSGSAPMTSTAAPAAPTAQHATTQRSGSARAVATNWDRRAQAKLKELSLYTGPIDGHRNTAYVRALEQFQRAHNIQANGRLNSQTRTALGIA